MFEPYIGKHGIGDLDFFFATPEAVLWYDPLKPYTLLEYEWVKENVDFSRMVFDIGSHHGNYTALFMACGASVIAVDAHKSNCDITLMNARRDYYEDFDDVTVLHAAIAPEDGVVRFSGTSNGCIVPSGGVEVESRKVTSIAREYGVEENKRIGVIKLDIEGGEFAILPAAIDEMPTVHTWIMELHPHAGDCDAVAQEFAKRGFDLLKVCRDTMTVREYKLGERWGGHATLIARKK